MANLRAEPQSPLLPLTPRPGTLACDDGDVRSGVDCFSLRVELDVKFEPKIEPGRGILMRACLLWARGKPGIR